MNLDGTPGLIDRRGAHTPAPLTPNRPAIRVPKPPTFIPLIAAPATSHLIFGFSTVSDDEPDEELAPEAFVYTGLIIFAVILCVVLFAWVIPSAHGLLPIWLKALIPMAALTYGLLFAVQRGWIVRTHS